MLFILYTFVLTGLIFYNGCFGLFNDSIISRKKYSLLFLGKITAVPVFLFVYNTFYGGIAQFDAGKFHHDVLAISDLAKKDLNFFLRFMFGLQDDAPGSYDYENAFKNTFNWSNGKIKDYLYNDNRVLIRFHVLLNFFAFGYYPVHALLNCFMSFIGINFLYKALKNWFEGKELQVLLVMCFFPALWLFTGALLKEGLTLLVLGCSAFWLKKLVDGSAGLAGVLWFLFLLFISFLLKPYLLLFAGICFALFFIANQSKRIKRKKLFFASVFVVLLIVINLASVTLKKRSLFEAAIQHQQRFIGVSKGGIFLEDSARFIRLRYDTSLVKQVKGKKDLFTINKNSPYMYWRPFKPNDTLYCVSNSDTLSRYELVYIIPESHSNIVVYRSDILMMMAASAYYTLFYPLFFNAQNLLQLLASIENLFVLASLLVILIGLVKKRKNGFLPLVFVFMTLTLCVLVGLTAPNSGAIFRYRAPALIFLLLAALYYLEIPAKKIFKNKLT